MWVVGIKQDDNDNNNNNNRRKKGIEKSSLLQAATDAGLRLGGFGDDGGVEIIELGVIEGDLGMASIMVDLHGLDVGGSNLAEGALQLGVAALLFAGAIGEAGLAAATVGGSGVEFGGKLLGGVLLGLSFSSHGWWWRRRAAAAAGGF